ncbi:cubilin-like [Haliotis rufescens]|uniref:cubilin-like n=1 Tax=Haliotis rufescens TaxID=6454 RepID=UPI00201EB857|nr:cubilin-like [Haliotis rufescens]
MLRYSKAACLDCSMHFQRVAWALVFVVWVHVMPTAESCEGHVELAATAQQASIFSTNYPSSYTNAASCSWRLYPATTGARVYIEVVDVDLDDTHGVCSDNLTIYAGADTGGKMLDRICGRRAPTLVKTEPGGSAYLSFSADSARVGRGFALRYWEALEGNRSVNYPQCVPGEVQRVEIGATPQRLDLPDYTAWGSTCDFLLETDTDHVLLLRPVSGTLAVDIDCTTDHITAYDGTTNEGAPIRLWCTETGFTAVYSSGSSLFLQTRLTKRVGTRSPAQLGLMAYRQPRASGDCDSSAFPTVQIPFSPVYMWVPFSYGLDGQPCPVSAAVRSLGPASSLVITVLASTSVTAVNCGSNYIQVSSYADTMEFLHQPKCSDEGRPYYRPEETELVIGQAVAGSGVRYLVEVKAEGYRCKKETQDIVVSVQPDLLSMDLPDFHGARSTQCTFRLRAAGADKLVKLTFKDSNLVRGPGVPCSGDYFVVFDGYNRSSPRLGEYCGQRLTRQPVFTSTSPYLFVELITATAGHFVHVQWEYSSLEDNRCFGTMELESSERDQFIDSPGYPSSYARDLSCLYLVTSPGDHAVRVDLLDPSLPADCSDNITVFDGNSTTSPVLGTWCASSNNTSLTSSHSAVLLQFTSSSHSGTSRFRVRYLDDVPKFASPEDPRVLPAIAAVVGLANSVGLVFLVSAACCYWRNRTQRGTMVIEEHLDLAEG